MRTSKGLFGGEFYLLLWIVGLLGGILLGVIGAFMLLTREETAPIPWGLLVPSYVFFALAATGSSLVNSIFSVFRIESFRPIIKRGIWLSLVLIVPAWIFIIIDLGRPFSMYNLYLLFHPTSRLGWMGWLYMAFALYLVMELVVVIREERMTERAGIVTGVLVLIATLAVHTNLGALFGAINAKPLWSSHFLASHFIVSAMMVGAVFHILAMIVTNLLKRGSVPGELTQLFSKYYAPMVIGLIILNWILVAGEYIPALFNPEEAPYAKLLLAGPYSVSFWLIEIVAGGIIPLVILFSRTTKNKVPWLLTASILVVLGVYFSKYDLLIGGQSIQSFAGGFISYFPGGGEILLLIGATAVCLLLYTLGELLLPLEPEEKPAWFVFVKRGASISN